MENQEYTLEDLKHDIGLEIQELGDGEISWEMELEKPGDIYTTHTISIYVEADNKIYLSNIDDVSDYIWNLLKNFRKNKEEHPLCCYGTYWDNKKQMFCFEYQDHI